MPVLNPVLNGDLYASAGEKFILAVAHRNILGIENDQWFLSVHGERLTCLVFCIDLGEKILCCNLRFSLLLFLFLLNCWLSDLVTLVSDVCPSALEPFKRVSEEQAANQVFLLRWALFARSELLSLLEIRTQGQEAD